MVTVAALTGKEVAKTELPSIKAVAVALRIKNMGLNLVLTLV